MGFALADEIETRAQHFIQQGVPRCEALARVVERLANGARKANQ